MHSANPEICSERRDTLYDPEAGETKLMLEYTADDVPSLVFVSTPEKVAGKPVGYMTCCGLERFWSVISYVSLIAT
jgi:hypothetical protein